MTESIIASAIRHEGQVWSLPRPARHHDIIRHIVEKTGVQAVIGEQGFLAGDGASQGRFVDRLEARKIAELAGQIIGRKDNDGVPYVANDTRLFSEDVW